jgi:hypothetical protein
LIEAENLREREYLKLRKAENDKKELNPKKKTATEKIMMLKSYCILNYYWNDVYLGASM